MWARIRRDDLWRTFWVWIPLVVLNTALAVSILSWGTARSGARDPGSPFLTCFWFNLALFLIFGSGRSRCTPFDSSLPIRGRRLWLGHLLAVLLGGAVLIGTSLGALALVSLVVAKNTDFTIQLVELGVYLVGGTLLGALLMEMWRPKWGRVPLTFGFAAWGLLVMGGISVLLMVGSLAGPAGAAVPLLLAVPAYAWCRHQSPEVYVMWPTEGVPSGERSFRDSQDAERLGVSWIWAVVKQLFGNPREIILIPGLAFFGAVLGGVFDAFPFSDDTRELRFLYIPMAVYILVVSVGPGLKLLRHFDPLPLERSRLLAVALGPGILVVGLSAILGAGAAWWLGPPVEYVNYVKTRSGWEINTPLRVFRVAWDGEPPRVQAPWGESQKPVAVPILKGTRLGVYSPFSAPAGSSARFIAFQLSRALKEVYGLSLTPEQVADRYLESPIDGQVAAKGGRFTLRSDAGGLEPRSGPVLPLLLLLTGLPWFLIVALLFHMIRTGVSNKRRQALVWTALIGILALFAVQMGLAMTHVAPVWAFRWVVERLAFQWGRTPWGTAAVWSAVLLALSAGYWLCARQFRQMEIPVRPIRFTFVEEAD